LNLKSKPEDRILIEKMINYWHFSMVIIK
jgi:hypothetical protein